MFKNAAEGGGGGGEALNADFVCLTIVDPQLSNGRYSKLPNYCERIYNPIDGGKISQANKLISVQSHPLARF